MCLQCKEALRVAYRSCGHDHDRWPEVAIAIAEGCPIGGNYAGRSMSGLSGEDLEIAIVLALHIPEFPRREAPRAVTYENMAV